MIADYHIHTPYCGHAQGKTAEYVEQAIRAGFGEIGFSDHLGRYYLSRAQRKRYWDWGMDEQTLARYYAELTELKDLFAGRIVIRIGLEVDFVEGAEGYLAPILNLYPFDFLLGSIHCLPKFGWHHLSKDTTTDREQLYTEYFSYARAAVESGLFQSLAHLDFIWRYCAWPHSTKDTIAKQIESVIHSATKKNCCIEINANGYLWSQTNRIGAIDPFEVIVECIRHYKTPITYGSDAHTPLQTGQLFGEIRRYLLDRGITTLTTFENKKPKTIQLEQERLH